MSDNLISKLTIEYLMNKDQYARYISQNQQTSDTKTINKKDKKFYKRRIFDLTKQLLNNEKPQQIFPDVSTAFDSYAKICIEYFKILDKTDILQEDYDGLTDAVNPNDSSIAENTQTEVNKLLMRSFNITEPNALEKLVKRTSTKIAQKPLIMPIQKDINLKDPALRVKGIKNEQKHEQKHEHIGKNNNIVNIYEKEVQAEKSDL